ncbi:MAG: PHP domain-containing protein [Promethearchaeota archaeon]
MRVWIILVVCAGLFAYIFFSFIFKISSTFRYHDYYDDEDVTYERCRPGCIPEDAFVIDMHAHTTASDGVLRPEQLVMWEISNGYNGVVVSDHNTMDAVQACREAALKIDPGFLVIPGMEFTTLNIHLNLIGLKTPGPKTRLISWAGTKKIIDIINHAHSEGAVVQFNHKDWYSYDILKKFPRQWWLQQGIDGWEIYNGFGFIDEEAIDFIEANKNKRVMYASAGTDVHDPAKHKRMYTEVITDDRTVEGVLHALKEGRTRVYYDVEVERERRAPEKGKLKVSHEKEAFVKKWMWIYWAGNILITGKHTRSLVAFAIAIIAGGIFLSLLF